MDLTQFSTLDIPVEYNFGLHNNLLSEMSTPRLSPPEVFHKEVTPSAGITNQKSSGRCWMFSGLNMLRRGVMDEHKFPSSFEFSQSYLFFWDKLERMNYLIVLLTMFKERGLTLEDRQVNFIMKDPFGDGGQWSMFENLVNKYGVVPKSVYGESKHSSNSRGVNMVLCQMFRDYVARLYGNRDVDFGEHMKKTYLTLVRFFGKPLNEFVFEYKKGKEIVNNKFSPLEFKEFCKIDMSRYVSVVHDPRNDFHKLYSIENLNNMEGGKSVKYMNMCMSRFKELTKSALDKNHPVWFGSDVGQFFLSKYSLLDENAFNYKRYLDIDIEMNKKERIETGESIPGHAMVYTGYHLDRFGKVDYWKIENSWGKTGPYDGYLVCSDKWFEDYTFQIVLSIDMLSEAEKRLWLGNVFEKTHPIWDPLGTLAS
jgi:bleomycin hydrolase